jgi:hypothetical protein
MVYLVSFYFQPLIKHGRTCKDLKGLVEGIGWKIGAEKLAWFEGNREGLRGNS